MRQSELNLSEEDRSTIEAIRSKGRHQAREVNRAHVLSCLHRDIPESQGMAVLGIGRTGCGVGGVRCATLRTPAPVRHPRRGPRHRVCLLSATQGTPGPAWRMYRGARVRPGLVASCWRTA